MSKPSRKYQLGRLSLAVWEKETQYGVRESFKVQRSYKDQQGQWQNTDFLDKDDLLNLPLLVNQALSSHIKKYDNTSQSTQQPGQVQNEFQGDVVDDDIPF